ncbi:MAG: carotenoid oxygenase family protein, partial [Gammaproteobacteria bacterium]|nr:carotenoid oxygenase family protein [Gammaproteobacteria bacterium]
MFSILRGFLPWILYSVLYGSNPEQYMLAISAALASSVIFDWKELKAGFILTRGTFFYFLLLLVLTAVFHWQWLQDNTWLISNCMLAGITFTSALIGKPFTLQYAKQQVREELWENAFFLQINYILTNIWGVIFLLTALVNYFHVEDPKINGLSYIILSNIGWFVGMYINKWFPDYWKARKFPKKATEKNTAKAVSPFLEGNFAPYRSEGKFDSLEIVGKIPDDLNGVLLRNGPNPQFDPVGSYHWFNGDGMLHAIRINQGRASYDNKWVRTERFKLENKAGKGLHPSDLSAENEDDNGNTANTNIIAYHEKLLALNEGASPVEIELKNLDTIGNYTFDGQMKRRHTAHPRIDHARQEFITYSYIGEDEKLFYYRFNKDNQLIVKKEILWPYAAMMHDFVTTENYVIFPIF